MPAKQKVKTILFIDTSDGSKVTIKLADKTYTDVSKHQRSQKLLDLIVKKLKSNGLKPEEIGSIEVHTGPGSYTGLRIGVTVAQTLGWILGVKVNGIDVRQGGLVKIKYE